MGDIADYVGTLRPSEREQFSDLIEECLVRETRIRSEATRAEMAAAHLLEEHQRLRAGIRCLRRAGGRASDTIGRIYLRTSSAPTCMQ